MKRLQIKCLKKPGGPFVSMTWVRNNFHQKKAGLGEAEALYWILWRWVMFLVLVVFVPAAKYHIVLAHNREKWFIWEMQIPVKQSDALTRRHVGSNPATGNIFFSRNLWQSVPLCYSYGICVLTMLEMCTMYKLSLVVGCSWSLNWEVFFIKGCFVNVAIII